MDKTYLQGKKDLTLPEFTCCICGENFNDFGNNPWPVNNDEDAKCCDECNINYVIPARIMLMYNNKKTTDNI